MHCNCYWSWTLNLKLSSALRCAATAFLKEKITEVFILYWLLIISDFMWQVICSCFRFDQNTKRVTHYFTALAFACLNKTAPPTIPQASIAPAYPQDGVITYTTVCSDSQAASNPIGLNLHLIKGWGQHILNPCQWQFASFQRLQVMKLLMQGKQHFTKNNALLSDCLNILGAWNKANSYD